MLIFLQHMKPYLEYKYIECPYLTCSKINMDYKLKTSIHILYLIRTNQTMPTKCIQ